MRIDEPQLSAAEDHSCSVRPSPQSEDVTNTIASRSMSSVVYQVVAQAWELQSSQDGCSCRGSAGINEAGKQDAVEPEVSRSHQGATIVLHVVRFQACPRTDEQLQEAAGRVFLLVPVVEDEGNEGPRRSTSGPLTPRPTTTRLEAIRLGAVHWGSSQLELPGASSLFPWIVVQEKRGANLSRTWRFLIRNGEVRREFYNALRRFSSGQRLRDAYANGDDGGGEEVVRLEAPAPTTLEEEEGDAPAGRNGEEPGFAADDGNFDGVDVAEAVDVAEERTTSSASATTSSLRLPAAGTNGTKEPAAAQAALPPVAEELREPPPAATKPPGYQPVLGSFLAALNKSSTVQLTAPPESAAPPTLLPLPTSPSFSAGTNKLLQSRHLSFSPALASRGTTAARLQLQKNGAKTTTRCWTTSTATSPAAARQRGTTAPPPQGRGHSLSHQQRSRPPPGGGSKNKNSSTSPDDPRRPGAALPLLLSEEGEQGGPLLGQKKVVKVLQVPMVDEDLHPGTRTPKKDSQSPKLFDPALKDVQGSQGAATARASVSLNPPGHRRRRIVIEPFVLSSAGPRSQAQGQGGCGGGAEMKNCSFAEEHRRYPERVRRSMAGFRSLSEVQKKGNLAARPKMMKGNYNLAEGTNKKQTPTVVVDQEVVEGVHLAGAAGCEPHLESQGQGLQRDEAAAGGVDADKNCATPSGSTAQLDGDLVQEPAAKKQRTCGADQVDHTSTTTANTIMTSPERQLVVSVLPPPPRSSCSPEQGAGAPGASRTTFAAKIPQTEKVNNKLAPVSILCADFFFPYLSLFDLLQLEQCCRSLFRHFRSRAFPQFERVFVKEFAHALAFGVGHGRWVKEISIYQGPKGLLAYDDGRPRRSSSTSSTGATPADHWNKYLQTTSGTTSGNSTRRLVVPRGVDPPALPPFEGSSLVGASEEPTPGQPGPRTEETMQTGPLLARTPFLTNSPRSNASATTTATTFVGTGGAFATAASPMITTTNSAATNSNGSASSASSAAGGEVISAASPTTIAALVPGVQHVAGHHNLVRGDLDLSSPSSSNAWGGGGASSSTSSSSDVGGASSSSGRVDPFQQQDLYPFVARGRIHRGRERRDPARSPVFARFPRAREEEPVNGFPHLSPRITNVRRYESAMTPGRIFNFSNNWSGRTTTGGAAVDFVGTGGGALVGPGNNNYSGGDVGIVGEVTTLQQQQTAGSSSHNMLTSFTRSADNMRVGGNFTPAAPPTTSGAEAPVSDTYRGQQQELPPPLPRTRSFVRAAIGSSGEEEAAEPLVPPNPNDPNAGARQRHQATSPGEQQGTSIFSPRTEETNTTNTRSAAATLAARAIVAEALSSALEHLTQRTRLLTEQTTTLLHRFRDGNEMLSLMDENDDGIRRTADNSSDNYTPPRTSSLAAQAQAMMTAEQEIEVDEAAASVERDVLPTLRSSAIQIADRAANIARILGRRTAPPFGGAPTSTEAAIIPTTRASVVGDNLRGSSDTYGHIVGAAGDEQDVYSENRRVLASHLNAVNRSLRVGEGNMLNMRSTGPGTIPLPRMSPSVAARGERFSEDDEQLMGGGEQQQYPHGGLHGGLEVERTSHENYQRSMDGSPVPPITGVLGAPAAPADDDPRVEMNPTSTAVSNRNPYLAAPPAGFGAVPLFTSPLGGPTSTSAVVNRPRPRPPRRITQRDYLALRNAGRVRELANSMGHEIEDGADNHELVDHYSNTTSGYNNVDPARGGFTRGGSSSRSFPTYHTAAGELLELDLLFPNLTVLRLYEVPRYVLVDVSLPIFPKLETFCLRGGTLVSPLALGDLSLVPHKIGPIAEVVGQKQRVSTSPLLSFRNGRVCAPEVESATVVAGGAGAAEGGGGAADQESCGALLHDPAQRMQSSEHNMTLEFRMASNTNSESAGADVNPYPSDKNPEGEGGEGEQNSCSDTTSTSTQQRKNLASSETTLSVSDPRFRRWRFLAGASRGSFFQARSMKCLGLEFGRVVETLKNSHFNYAFTDLLLTSVINCTSDHVRHCFPPLIEKDGVFGWASSGIGSRRRPPRPAEVTALIEKLCDSCEDATELLKIAGFLNADAGGALGNKMQMEEVDGRTGPSFVGSLLARLSGGTSSSTTKQLGDAMETANCVNVVHPAPCSRSSQSPEDDHDVDHKQRSLEKEKLYAAARGRTTAENSVVDALFDASARLSLLVWAIGSVLSSPYCFDPPSTLLVHACKAVLSALEKINQTAVGVNTRLQKGVFHSQRDVGRLILLGGLGPGSRSCTTSSGGGRGPSPSSCAGMTSDPELLIAADALLSRLPTLLAELQKSRRFCCHSILVILRRSLLQQSKAERAMRQLVAEVPNLIPILLPEQLEGGGAHQEDQLCKCKASGGDDLEQAICVVDLVGYLTNFANWTEKAKRAAFDAAKKVLDARKLNLMNITSFCSSPRSTSWGEQLSAASRTVVRTGADGAAASPRSFEPMNRPDPNHRFEASEDLRHREDSFDQNTTSEGEDDLPLHGPPDFSTSSPRVVATRRNDRSGLFELVHPSPSTLAHDPASVDSDSGREEWDPYHLDAKKLTFATSSKHHPKRLITRGRASNAGSKSSSCASSGGSKYTCDWNVDGGSTEPVPVDVVLLPAAPASASLPPVVPDVVAPVGSTSAAGEDESDSSSPLRGRQDESNRSVRDTSAGGVAGEGAEGGALSGTMGSFELPSEGSSNETIVPGETESHPLVPPFDHDDVNRGAAGAVAGALTTSAARSGSASESVLLEQQDVASLSSSTAVRRRAEGEFVTVAHAPEYGSRRQYQRVEPMFQNLVSGGIASSDTSDQEAGEVEHRGINLVDVVAEVELQASGINAALGGRGPAPAPIPPSAIIDPGMLIPPSAINIPGSVPPQEPRTIFSQHPQVAEQEENSGFHLQPRPSRRRTSTGTAWRSSGSSSNSSTPNFGRQFHLAEDLRLQNEQNLDDQSLDPIDSAAGNNSSVGDLSIEELQEEEGDVGEVGRRQRGGENPEIPQLAHLSPLTQLGDVDELSFHLTTSSSAEETEAAAADSHVDVGRSGTDVEEEIVLLRSSDPPPTPVEVEAGNRSTRSTATSTAGPNAANVRITHREVAVPVPVSGNRGNRSVYREPFRYDHMTEYPPFRFSVGIGRDMVTGPPQLQEVQDLHSHNNFFTSSGSSPRPFPQLPGGAVADHLPHNLPEDRPPQAPQEMAAEEQSSPLEIEDRGHRVRRMYSTALHVGYQHERAQSRSVPPPETRQGGSLYEEVISMDVDGFGREEEEEQALMQRERRRIRQSGMVMERRGEGGRGTVAVGAVGGAQNAEFGNASNSSSSSATSTVGGTAFGSSGSGRMNNLDAESAIERDGRGSPTLPDIREQAEPSVASVPATGEDESRPGTTTTSTLQAAAAPVNSSAISLEPVLLGSSATVDLNNSAGGIGIGINLNRNQLTESESIHLSSEQESEGNAGGAAAGTANDVGRSPLDPADPRSVGELNLHFESQQYGGIRTNANANPVAGSPEDSSGPSAAQPQGPGAPTVDRDRISATVRATLRESRIRPTLLQALAESQNTQTGGTSTPFVFGRQTSFGLNPYGRQNYPTNRGRRIIPDAAAPATTAAGQSDPQQQLLPSRNGPASWASFSASARALRFPPTFISSNAASPAIDHRSHGVTSLDYQAQMDHGRFADIFPELRHSLFPIGRTRTPASAATRSPSRTSPLRGTRVNLANLPTSSPCSQTSRAINKESNGCSTTSPASSSTSSTSSSTRENIQYFHASQILDRLAYAGYRPAVKERGALKKREEWISYLRPGTHVDAMDTEQAAWYESYIVSIDEDKCLVHFLGWNTTWRRHIFLQSADALRLQPRNWVVPEWRRRLRRQDSLDVKIPLAQVLGNKLVSPVQLDVMAEERGGTTTMGTSGKGNEYEAPAPTPGSSSAATPTAATEDHDPKTISLPQSVEMCTFAEENMAELRPRWKVAQIVQLGPGRRAQVRVLGNPLPTTGAILMGNALAARSPSTAEVSVSVSSVVPAATTLSIAAQQLEGRTVGSQIPASAPTAGGASASGDGAGNPLGEVMGGADVGGHLQASPTQLRPALHLPTGTTSSAGHHQSSSAGVHLSSLTFGGLLDSGYSLLFWVDLNGNAVQPFGTHTVKPSTRRPVWSFLEPPSPPHMLGTGQDPWEGGGCSAGGCSGGENDIRGDHETAEGGTYGRGTGTSAMRPHMFAL